MSSSISPTRSRQLVVIAVGNGQELDAVLHQISDGRANVAAKQSEMLGTGAAIKLDVFLDLRFALFALGRLVDREFDIVLAVRHDDRHQCRILGRDVLVVKRDVAEKAHHVAIKIAPLAHFAELDVADDMIDHHDAGRLAFDVLRDKAGQERADVRVFVGQYRRRRLRSGLLYE